MLRMLTATLALLMALVVLGCSGSSGEPASEQAAAVLVPVEVADLQVSSPNFQELVRPRKRIPKENTCFAENMSPPLDWSGVPEGTKSLALIAEEPEERLSSANQATFNAAASGDAVHWVLYNIPPTAAGLPEGVPTTTDVLPDGTVQGVNDFGGVGYSGPCPPSSVVQYYAGQYHVPKGAPTSDTPRDYYFRLYALDAMLELAPGATAAELTAATEGHVLGYGETMGKYQAPRQQGWYRDDTETPVANTPTPMP
jgi:Raf kinase inhibitor-like YbhB/YbcL family protein